jgi:hypothetical protein
MPRFPFRISRPSLQLLHKSRFYSAKVSKPLRILFCGSDDFSSASVRALVAERERDPQLIKSIDVLCRPGKRSGRSLKNIREGSKEIHKGKATCVDVISSNKSCCEGAVASYPREGHLHRLGCKYSSIGFRISSDQRLVAKASRRGHKSHHCCLLWIICATENS